ncbi:shikimate dehydrogenase family protein [Phenylobacterium deserti]|uniref:Shikimate dehydrogenase (NADP(+)) n=1 Tax=Phenylobacterium deserti TaxID=1914756 RepID=A0A328AWT2_9CAUL|nr:shikimate dehydrogenase [Phenylobacterium deserti]RAK57318.1 shikimate dehydrogenase [Phenylobacterium deserti]
MSPKITGATRVAGIAGNPVIHSLSPLIHNAWIEAAGLDAVYVPFAPQADDFVRFAEGLRGGSVRGLNITMPFKEAALSVANQASQRATLAGAANLIVFNADGTIVADNVDGLGLLEAFAAQAPGVDVTSGPVVVIGAGGAARGAAAAFAQAGCPEVRVVNRTLARAEMIAGALGEQARAFALSDCEKAFDGARAVVNATSAGLAGQEGLSVPLEATPVDCAVMDMVYKPLITPFLQRAQALRRPTVDGLEMLVRQAIPSFEALFGAPPPASVDARAICLEAIGAAAEAKAAE